MFYICTSSDLIRTSRYPKSYCKVEKWYKLSGTRRLIWNLLLIMLMSTGMSVKKIIKRKVGSVNVYEVTEKEILIFEKGLPKAFTILSPVLGCFALAISFIRDILNNDPSDFTLTSLLVLSGLFIALGFFVLFYNIVLKKEKTDVLDEIRRKKRKSNNSIASKN